jgi:hypothetical protein
VDGGGSAVVIVAPGVGFVIGTTICIVVPANVPRCTSSRLGFSVGFGTSIIALSKATY